MGTSTWRDSISPTTISERLINMPEIASEQLAHALCELARRAAGDVCSTFAAMSPDNWCTGRHAAAHRAIRKRRRFSEAQQVRRGPSLNVDLAAIADM